MAWRALAPAPVEIAMGKTPRMKANEVMRIGRKRSRAASSTAWCSVRPSRCSVTANSDRKSTRLNSSHLVSSYAVFCLKKKNFREVLFGTCSMYINGKPHGPCQQSTVRQLHMRAFKDRSKLVVEPWRGKASPVIKDLMVDRKAFDGINQADGFISVSTGNAVDANAIPVVKEKPDASFAASFFYGSGARRDLHSFPTRRSSD